LRRRKQKKPTKKWLVYTKQKILLKAKLIHGEMNQFMLKIINFLYYYNIIIS